MTEHDYLIAWSLYAVAALGCLWVSFVMTGWMWRYLKEPLRVLIAVLLFTPTIVDPAKDVYAPALAITALDLLFKVGSTVWTALLDLGMYALCAFIAYAVFVLVRWPIENKRKARQAQQQARQEAAAKEAAEEDQDEQPFTADDRYARRPAPAMVPGTGRTRVEPRL
ncbi:MFS transporter [Pseudomonas sp. Leaf127]|uniref:hypothetical protein n=1 Tax=Pseudomonas TaxID=286 RepID=UPI0007026EAE|nr:MULTISPECIES: hypothetical protein [Pseudomonas]KQQ68275.1 MFS transporter [Pseudomonas sp. Leaf127]